MEKAKEMKTIKMVEPFYANHLGNGMFAGTTWIFQCTKCGLTVEKSDMLKPSGTCPAGRGPHNWVRTQY